tara:strand:+ start:41 stop:502 length:462 start_codon:yes stop_codon:yes gene_type:complete
VNLQDEIKKTKELLLQLEGKQAKELAKPKSKRILVEVDCWGLNALGDVNKYGGFSISLNDNAFVDEESAQLQAQRNTLVYRMRVAALDCPVDWSNNEGKYHFYWSYDRGEINITGRTSLRYTELPHFACQEKLIKFMKSLSKDEQKLLICGVE